MSIAYTPPGVSVSEIVTPSITPLLGVEASVCLIGMSAGSITKTDIVTLNGTTAVTLPRVPDDATMTVDSIIMVADSDPSSASSGYDTTTGYVVDDDYEFDEVQHTITRVTDGVPDGNTVYVTYTYTPADYFNPIRLDNISAIEDRFGSAWDVDGTTINSPLSFASIAAFENGAQSLVLQPLYYSNSGVRQQPTDAQNAAAANWANTLTSLRDIEDINVLVPIIGQSQPEVGDAAQIAVFQALQDHIKFMAVNQQYLFGVLGEDSSGSTDVATMATLRADAITLASRFGGQFAQDLALVSPSRFTRSAPGSTAGEIVVGGQYMAAAIAGMVAGRRVSDSLTRKVVAGFKNVVEFRSKDDKNTDAANGLLVIEQKGLLIKIRHGVTLDTTSTVRREISIVRAKNLVIESVRDTLDNQIIGEVIADGNAPGTVADAVISVLEALVGARDIVAYSGVQARTLTVDPTMIEVRFSYRPAFPVNFVSVVFSLDLTSGEVTLPTATEVATF